MKKQFTKIKIAAENLGRSNKSDCKDSELEIIEKQVDKYKDVLEKMVRKLPAVSSTTDTQDRDKRIKKNSHYKIGQALEESSKDLSKEMPLHHVLSNCGELEKSIAECIVDSELETETEVVRRLKQILDNEIQEISSLKRNVSRTVQEYQSLKRSYEASIRLDEAPAKIAHIKDQQEQCEVKLEKERDSLAALMFELITKEDVIVQSVRDYVLYQRNFHERALQKVNTSLASIQDVIQSTAKSRFGTSLTEHLESTNREISYILELCICCLVENGLYEEGLLRVGCASTKLRRMKHALEAQYVKTPLPLEYQDPHVIGSILKLYLRELPEPLLTYKYYKDFINAAECGSESERKAAIKATLAKLPAANYANLRYLTRFLWLVTQNVDHNKMSSQNVAIVMSPNMLWPRVDKSNPADYLGQVNSSSAVNVIVELLISQWEYFFEGEVDFFVTLARSKLFVEGKSKSGSSNEHLDRNDTDSLESPRYGTIRRQKACAPSPPSAAKVVEKISTSNEIQRNGEVNSRVKELFPNTTATAVATPAVNKKYYNNNNNGNNSPSAEKPEKPPLPKLPQFQQPPAQVTPQAQPLPEPPQSAKPVPMTRTQFFGLDNLPSPVADRKSTESIGGSLAFKPDLPQKPKIPKRPMVLSLSGSGGGGKSDDETTPTQAQSQTTETGNGSVAANGGIAGIGSGGGSGGGGGIVSRTTEKFIEKLRSENCDNNFAATATRENQHNQQLLLSEQNANVNSANSGGAGSSNRSSIGSLYSVGGGGHSRSNSNTNANICAPTQQQTDATAFLAAAVTSTASVTTPSAVSTAQAQTQTPAPITRITPTTPVSPHMILTKRPTVPAPPPPSVVKKQSD
ncbi:PREDICTED: LOW QUALITY PROTEIN: rho GTPase-activating protein 92B-like [Rhagoletis zephyria]|uniref:LOW QUALITY PROTEIN: rho GTPase-activating protein 92B-like n=1 Tax=Rhagoletis zephyria TaxID=28612 RepID=UPI0008112699|nr:PREDICTED: LOW QUALITY PROTEIN: rho GTPase-activating protein 92B-like [Rhagoletis zephyria]